MAEILMVSCPMVVIAGTSSGTGKTSFAVALARALFRHGKRVQTFKVGPDFLDPTYLEIASGRPCYNLDGWMAGEDYCRRLFERAAADADFVIVEGVMGLFDGADPQSMEGSTAAIARLLDIPIVLVANVHGMSRSFAALVLGYTIFEPGLSFAGVIANHCGSERHAEWLSLSLEAAGLPPLLGAIRRGGFAELSSRHLGLVTADHKRISESFLNSMADTLEQNVALEKLFLVAATVRDPLQDEAKIRTVQKGIGITRPLRIAVARDDAFHFYYADLLNELTAAGCEIVFFSPLVDSLLPEEISGLYIGGGYPELYAEKLSKNIQMLKEIRDYADSGRPLYAECGGRMYLSRGIETGGAFHSLAGVLPARTKMRSGKKTLGYVEVTLKGDSLWGHPGDTLRGHEFHYSELIDNPAATPEWKTIYTVQRRRSEEVEDEGFQRGSILVSYLHLHFASKPSAIDCFIEQCGGKS